MYAERSLVLFLFHVIILVQIVTNQVEKGPYRTVLKNITNCPLREKRGNVMDALDLYPQYSSGGKLVVQGNVTVYDFKDVKLSITAFRKTQKKFEAKNMNCHNTVADIFYTALRLPINKRTCYIAPGTYTFRNLDLNKCLHKFIQSVTYGPFDLKIEAFKQHKSQRRYFACALFSAEHYPVAES